MVGTTMSGMTFLFMLQQQPSFLTSYFSQSGPTYRCACSICNLCCWVYGRPLGGLVFGHFGDKIGRKSMLLLTLMLMGIPTVLIGLLPTYESIGYWAAIGLVILRFIQGMPWAVSGRCRAYGSRTCTRRWYRVWEVASSQYRWGLMLAQSH
uniref:Putative MFS transporter-like protein n=1 Tax=Acinetobacter baumannii TaxID=470 RepID=G8CPT1_ACIBA|nr:putative MFS transporter-like protein [Acinetobacter baumannii]